MPRVPRRGQWTEAGCYHVITRGHNRETLFADEADFRYFLELLGRYRDRFHWQLYHYCLMSNHVHLLVRLENPGALSRIVAGLLRAYVHYFNGRYGFVGHLFQGRFKSPAIEAESYLLSCGRYIERNPLEARLAVEPWQYPWSSCRAYSLGEADPLVSFDPYYLELALEQERRQQRWREFWLAEDPKEHVVRQDDWVVGGGGFRQRLDRPGARPVPHVRGRPRASKRKSQSPTKPFSTQPTLPFEEA